MISATERKCIELAGQARAASAARRLAELRERGMGFEPVIRMKDFGFGWTKNPRRWAAEIVRLPVTIAGFALLLALTPVLFVGDWLFYQAAQSRLRREIRKASEPVFPPDESPSRSLDALWRMYGLDERVANDAERLGLLKAWIRTLYGAPVAESIDYEGRVLFIEESRRRPEPSTPEELLAAPNFVHRPAIDSLGSWLSGELPPLAEVA